jgi:hypothetical protein
VQVLVAVAVSYLAIPGGSSMHKVQIRWVLADCDATILEVPCESFE